MAIADKSPGFPETRWSVIAKLTSADSGISHRALSTLCETYWYPIYAYFRRSGKSAHDAEDLTQGLFARLVDRELLASADPDKGRLRTFLLTCARHFMTDAWHRETAAKRGGGETLQSFDPQLAEQRYVQETADQMSPDRLYQRRWAMAVLETSLEKLASAHSTTPEQRELFEALRPFLGFGETLSARYEDIAEQMQIPVGTLKNKVFRLRQQWRELLFEQVGQTLENPDPDSIRAELQELLGAV